ncbi:hypothetical protein HPB51_023826 [Rhipicephalus microplus]|uniref:Schlafen AlbA-2 domain-containing protein n=1 Tax=Rhipicephalus microplus TaxID=6941 RepID=A0A9J6ED89_RHIMP|nr:hypothetical protein HPB51_023826 [Rhipicephalus microplus]
MHQMEVTMQDGGKNVEERADATGVRKRHFYKFGEHVRMEEHQRIEFKAHEDISIEELSAACKDQHSRQTISRTICAFLNTGRGGTIFLGILDNGEVNGLHLTEYQKNHLALSLENLMLRHKPAVPKHMYELRFVPVISEGVPLPTNERREMNSKERFRPHKLQCSTPCWCDDEATAQLSVGGSVMRYVVEIKLSAWDSSDPRNSTEGVFGSSLATPAEWDRLGSDKGEFWPDARFSVSRASPGEAVNQKDAAVKTC